MLKTCTRCGEAKPHTEEFFYRQNRAGKLKSSCKPCESARVSARYHSRTEVQVAVRAQSRAWAAENRERMRALQRAYRASHVEEERTRNRERKASQMAEPASRLRLGLRRRLSELRRSRVVHPEITTDSAIGCSWAEYVDHIERQLLAGMTWDNYGSWQIDHVEPIAKADLSDLHGALAVFSFKNTRPIWAHENQKKGKR